MLIPRGDGDGWWFLQQRKRIRSLASVPVLITTAIPVAGRVGLLAGCRRTAPQAIRGRTSAGRNPPLPRRGWAKLKGLRWDCFSLLGRLVDGQHQEGRIR
jgi:hypothetical protein